MAELEPESEASGFLKPLYQQEFQYISDLVYHYCGINLHQGKKELVRARLSRRLRDLDMGSFKEYCDYLKSGANSEEMNTMINILSTNLTSFFRENKHFEFLQKQLPVFLKDREREGRHKFRLWSTACSSGEEPYSMAVVLAEEIPKFPRIDAKILATDISSRVLQKAMAGNYTKARLKEFPPHLKVKYFKYDGGNYQVCDEIKRLITFKQLNVIGLWPFKGPFDIIFCRNMMIYFDKATQARLIERFEDYLAPGGYLFVGHSESLVGIPHHLKYVEPTI